MTTQMANTKYLICMTSRVGSHLLVSLLKNAEVTGQTHPYERLTPERVDSVREMGWSEEEAKEFVEKVFELCSMPGGGAGFNVGWVALEYLSFKIRNKKISTQNILSVFPPNVKYIYLTRKDEVRQAISHIKMVQSGIAKLKNRARGGGDKSFDSFVFDFWGIVASIVEIQRQKRKWEKFFEYNRISPLSLEYEEWTKDFKGTVTRVLEYLGIPVSDNLEIKIDFIKLRDALSGEWVKRYHETRTKMGGCSIAGYLR